MTKKRSNIDFSQFLTQKITEINRMYPIVIFEDGFLTIECAWRLRKGSTVIVGYAETEVIEKRDKAYEIFEQALLNNHIKDIVHYEEISDLSITFDNDFCLDLFHDSSLYEGWQLSGKKGFILVSLPGGSYSYCLSED